MKIGAAFFIAFRYLLGRAKEGGRYLRGAAAGIALSLIPIVVTLMVADGMIQGITDRYLELGTGHIQITNYNDPGNPETILPIVQTLEGFRGAWAEVQGLCILVSTKGSRGATIRAVENSFWDDEGSQKYLQTISGESKLGPGRELMLGEELATAIGAEPGSTVRVMTFQITQEGRFIPRLSSFTVKGIISSGYRELDSLWCIMSLEEGLRILPDSASPYHIIKIDNPYKNAEGIAYELYDRLGSGYGIRTWESLLRAQYSSYESTRQILLFIMALIVVVAAVNVSSATSMLAIERRRDIAVLKTGGAGAFFTSGIFLWGAFLTGLIGSVIGLSAGLLLGINVNALLLGLEKVFSFFTALFNGEPVAILNSGYYLEEIPIIINMPTIIMIGIFTVLCSVLASWIPARRAGKLKPIEILRKY
ncbi:MAG: ABC transporter permease [Treponema sp.]|nr:ABC transporter permease [Treponema sp.]